jgi:hypothetical protein
VHNRLVYRYRFGTLKIASRFLPKFNVAIKVAVKVRFRPDTAAIFHLVALVSRLPLRGFLPAIMTFAAMHPHSLIDRSQYSAIADGHVLDPARQPESKHSLRQAAAGPKTSTIAGVVRYQLFCYSTHHPANVQVHDPMQSLHFDGPRQAPNRGCCTGDRT